MIKNLSKHFFLLLGFCSLFLCSAAFCTFEEPDLILYNSSSTSQGIKYRHFISATPQSVHVLEVDPHLFSILPARALDKCVGRENVQSLAIRKKALAAFNGGFFDIGKHEGAPCGILKISKQWYGLASKPRGAIGWKCDGQITLFDCVLTHLDGIDFYVDSQTGETTKEQWEEMDHILGGTPLLIKNGEKIEDFSYEQTIASFLTLRHARTCVGILPNGNWVFVVVDGKQPYLSLGMTMNELADFMQSLGCVTALNLDGGGSSTFVYNHRHSNYKLTLNFYLGVFRGCHAALREISRVFNELKTF